MKTIETVFCTLLFILSNLALILVGYKCATESHSLSDLSVLIVFCIPLLLSSVFSVYFSLIKFK